MSINLNIFRLEGGESMQKLCIKNGKVWEKSSLHLKSAIPGFDREDITKLIALDLLKASL